MVTFLPMYIGHVLATREIVPGFGLWARFLADASSQGATAAVFLETLHAWTSDAGDFLLAAVVMGPLIWTATLLINDVHDLPGDRINPRKARSPLVQGVVSAGWAQRMAYLFAALSLLGAVFIGIAFTALVFVNLALAWLYSAPPLRLKTRPGADVAVNAIGVGLLSAMAGWSVAAPLSAFPFAMAPQGILVAIAVYVPTTLVDHDWDRQMGYATLATHLGPERAYRIGWWAWILCNLGALGLSWQDAIIPRAMLPILLVFAPLLVGQYHAFIGKARDGPEMVKGIILCSFTFLAVNAVFALMYTGLWIT